MARAEPAQQGRRIGAAGVIALTAAAIEREAFAAVTIYQVAQPRGDFRYRSVPIDFIEAAVGTAAQRRRQPVPVMGVERNSRGLVAEIALRFRILTVAAHFGDTALIDQDLDAAIDIADIAGGLLPFLVRHRVLLPGSEQRTYYMIIIIQTTVLKRI